MKLTNKQLRQIIKEELEKVLEEGIPALGLAGLMGKASHNIKNRDSTPKGRIYRRRDGPTSEDYLDLEAPAGTSVEEIMMALNDHGFAANISGQGGINIKHKGQTFKIYPNTDLSLPEALQNAIDQIVEIDPNFSIRSKASRRIGSTVNIDDPMMERKRRRR